MATTASGARADPVRSPGAARPARTWATSRRPAPPRRAHARRRPRRVHRPPPFPGGPRCRGQPQGRAAQRHRAGAAPWRRRSRGRHAGHVAHRNGASREPRTHAVGEGCRRLRGCRLLSGCSRSASCATRSSLASSCRSGAGCPSPWRSSGCLASSPSTHPRCTSVCGPGSKASDGRTSRSRSSGAPSSRARSCVRPSTSSRRLTTGRWLWPSGRHGAGGGRAWPRRRPAKPRWSRRPSGSAPRSPPRAGSRARSSNRSLDPRPHAAWDCGSTWSGLLRPEPGSTGAPTCSRPPPSGSGRNPSSLRMTRWTTWCGAT